MGATRGLGRLFQRKSIDLIRAEAEGRHLKRELGVFNLIFLGIGCIVGAGIYVLTGNAAANFAGPAVVLSFVIAGAACAFAALCYAELAATIPASGSAYTYSYATLGELFAWIMGWLLVLEYGVAAATVATGWSGYLISLLADFGVHFPAAATTSLVQSPTGQPGFYVLGSSLDLPAAGGMLLVTTLLVFGIKESATFNNVVVVIKVSILIALLVFGFAHVDPDNWRPFIPPNEGGFRFGVPGVVRAASVIFFAYVGFEAVSTAALEAKNPQRDMPIGILTSLFVCTGLYILVAAVLTGLVPYRRLGVPDPIALGVDALHMPWFSLVMKCGAVIGLLSVMLVLTYGQSRVFFSMARDGLLPPMFARLHPRFRTPYLGTVLLGVLIATLASLLPITILSDLVNLGTAAAFGLVCVSTIYLRNARPDLPRPFKVPGGGFRLGRFQIDWVPLAGVLFCLLMAVPVIADVADKATKGNRLPAILLVSYITFGLVLYFVYGFWNSRLGRGEDVAHTDDESPNPISPTNG